MGMFSDLARLAPKPKQDITATVDKPKLSVVTEVEKEVEPVVEPVVEPEAMPTKEVEQEIEEEESEIDPFLLYLLEIIAHSYNGMDRDAKISVLSALNNIINSNKG